MISVKIGRMYEISYIKFDKMRKICQFVCIKNHTSVKMYEKVDFARA